MASMLIGISDYREKMIGISLACSGKDRRKLALVGNVLGAQRKEDAGYLSAL